jgi:Glycosyltransferase family 87
MTPPRKSALALFIFCIGISILWGLALSTRAADGSSGFQAIYYGTRCLLQHHNPYNQSELASVYRAEGGEYPTQSHAVHESVTLYVNFPTTFVCLTPFALLPYPAAHALWLTLIAGIFTLASLMMFDLGAAYSRGVSLFLVCVLVANAEIIFSSGNTAGIVVSLCVIGAWCFLKDRFVPAGMLCLGLSLAIKPHVVGFVWLYFLLAGGVNRKRALQSLVIPVVVGLSALFWVSHVAPNWMDDWRSNLSAISSPGGINQPGPNSVTGRTPDMVIDLQSALSVFKDDPRVYNPISFAVCGALILLWSIRSFRSRYSHTRALLALAVIAPLSILVAYHRPYDAKILLLTIPACAMLSSAGGRVGRIALLVNTAAIVLTADIPLAILVVLAGKLHVSPIGYVGKMLTTLLLRPAPIAMLAMAVFYLWAFVRFPELEAGSCSHQPDSMVDRVGPATDGSIALRPS